MHASVCACSSSLRTHLAEPVPEGRGASEDGGLLHFVAALRGNEAGDTLNVPPAVGAPAVQGPPGVSLSGGVKEERSGELQRRCRMHG